MCPKSQVKFELVEILSLSGFHLFILYSKKAITNTTTSEMCLFIFVCHSQNNNVDKLYIHLTSWKYSIDKIWPIIYVCLYYIYY
jgi:hypothetical protein